MRIKIIAAIFICFYSNQIFSQTKKTVSYEWHLEVPDRPESCWIPPVTGGFENIIIYLFPDSTFMCTYSSDGNLHPECKTKETARGRIISKDGSLYLVRNAGGNEFITDSLRSRLEQFFATDLSTRIGYSGDKLFVYSQADPYLVFRKTNFFARDKRDKRFRKTLPVPLQF